MHRLDAGVIAWLQFIIINGLEDKGFALLSRITDEQEPGEDDDDDTDAAAEPQVGMEVNQPVDSFIIYDY